MNHHKTLVRNALLSCLIVVGATTPASTEYEVPKNVELRGIIEDIINSSLSKIIAGIPDPIFIKYLEYNFGNSTNKNHSLLSGEFNVSNLRIDGLSNTRVSAIRYDAWTQSLNLTFSDIRTSFNYWADLQLLELVPLYGSGINIITMGDLKLFIIAKATVGQNWSLNIKEVAAIMNIADLQFNLNGFIDDAVFSALVETVLNDNVPDFINGHEEFITRVLSPIVKDVLNRLLHPNSTYYHSNLVHS